MKPRRRGVPGHGPWSGLRFVVVGPSARSFNLRGRGRALGEKGPSVKPRNKCKRRAARGRCTDSGGATVAGAGRGDGRRRMVDHHHHRQPLQPKNLLARVAPDACLSRHCAARSASVLCVADPGGGREGRRRGPGAGGWEPTGCTSPLGQGRGQGAFWASARG